MKNIGLSIIGIVICAFSFQACAGDDEAVDTEKPVIVLDSPTEHQAFLPGESISLEAGFYDNLALGSYKIEIHIGEDGHTHKGMEEFGDWFYTKTGAIEPGLKSFDFLDTIEIPLTINGLPIEEGHYHLGIYLTDAAGNERQAFTEIVVGEDDGH